MDITIYLEEAAQVSFAFIIGAVIGLEREFRAKPAGFRTMIFICVGSCLYTILSKESNNVSPDRIASNIVTGIGFLGAGVIFKEDNQVKGLTTACVIWIVAAIGMAVGAGYFEQAMGVTAVVLLALLIFPFVENYIERRFTKRTYRIVKKYENESLDRYEESIRTSRLKLHRGKQELANGIISGTWVAIGSPRNHKKFVDKMLSDHKILEFDF